MEYPLVPRDRGRWGWIYETVSKNPDWVHNEINNNNKHSLRSNTNGYGGKTHKIAMQLHLVAGSCTIRSSRS
jgi:pyruvoyl-dependent arginine decarboxylase (PvlArgDC)